MRVRTEMERRPRLPFPRDFDYVARLEEMRPILWSLQHGGRCVPLLLEKARRMLDVAAFPFAKDAADGAIFLFPKSCEAHWLRALACLGMALQRLGLVAHGPSLWGVYEPSASPAIEHVDEARRSLAFCVELTELTNCGDQEAADLLFYLDGLGCEPSDATLRNRLRPLLV